MQGSTRIGSSHINHIKGDQSHPDDLHVGSTDGAANFANIERKSAAMRFRAKVISAALTVDVVELDAVDEQEACHVIESAGARMLDLRHTGAIGFSRARRG